MSENDPQKRSNGWMTERRTGQGWSARSGRQGWSSDANTSESGWNLRGQSPWTKQEPNQGDGQTVPDLSTAEGLKQYWFGNGPDLTTAEGIREYWYGDGPDLSTPEGINQYWFGNGPDLSTPEGINQYWFGNGPDLSTPEGINQYWSQSDTPESAEDNLSPEWKGLLEDHLQRLYNTYKSIASQEQISFEEFKRLVSRRR